MTPRKLAIVGNHDQLSGRVPARFEKLARTVSCGTSEHHGLIRVCMQMAKRAVYASIPPSGRTELDAALHLLERYTRGQASPEEVSKQRMLCFAGAPAIEQLAAQAVVRAQIHLPRAEKTALDEHADHVVARYTRSAAYFAVSSVIHCLDGGASPPLLLEVPRAAEGAKAYQLAGLGAARHQAFRKAAYDQARWEGTRLGADEHTVNHLAVQIFHEYLGGRYRVHADAERLLLADFIEWALS